MEERELPYKIRNANFKPGKLSEEHFWLLIEISSMHSERVILALKDYLVFGYTRKYVIERYHVNNGYFSVSLARLINVSKTVSKLIPYYQD
ncbi:transcriptional regulator [Salmonella enterica]|nr:PapB/FocB family fimbrial expression transcriptional regulator [Escherichia coli]EHR6806612.1 transcriptional regulator [Salmonella enterica]